MQRIDAFLFKYEYDYFNRVGYSAPFISFFSMQLIRLILLFLMAIVWFMNLYINVKKCIIYMNVWALTYATLATGFLFVSSGRQVIERKLAERGDPVREKERSELWKFGVVLYAMAMPWVFTVNVMFFAFYRQDIID